MDGIEALTKITALRIRFKIDDIDRTYNKQFQYWLWQNSHEQDIPQENESLEYDEKGFITNAKFSKRTKTGFDLLEQDFIDSELRRINRIKPDLLNLDNRKYLEFLKSYFQNNQPQPESKVITKSRKGITAKHHVVSFILDCYANNKPLPTGKGWETAGEKRKKYTGAGNTFYQNHNIYIAGKSLKNEINIINLIGEDWRDIVLELSDDPKTLETYLEHQFVKVGF